MVTSASSTCHQPTGFPTLIIAGFALLLQVTPVFIVAVAVTLVVPGVSGVMKVDQVGGVISGEVTVATEVFEETKSTLVIVPLTGTTEAKTS
jgi:hypothetical protein